MAFPRLLGLRRGARPGHAFTLLELIIAVVVLAVLASIAIPTFARDISNASLARDTAALTSFANDAQTVARPSGLTIPDVPSITSALAEMPATSSGAKWSGAASLSARAVGSSAYGTVSYDVADDPTRVGYAMLAQNGGCVMALTTASETTSWHYSASLGGWC
jgi:prepilin-type N-terminal cleavage/methylation domain-containing protein